MKNVEIYSDFITLGQLLKKLDIVSTGGEVKYFLDSERVMVNGQPDSRRGRKLYPGDTVVLQGETYSIKAV